MFPSSEFPELGSQNFAWAGGEKPTVYPLAQLMELVRYADERGVTFVPEMEVPGHSGQLRGTFPELFGPGYAGPGSKGLTDGLLAAGYDFFEAGWIGWANTGRPLEITIDLGRPRQLDSVSPHFLHAAGGVMPPDGVNFLVSDDKVSFRPIAAVSLDSGTRQRGWYTAELGGVEARYLRISVEPAGDWTFVDEVVINGDLPEPTLPHAVFHKPITLANPPNAYTAPGIEGMTDGYVSEAANFLAFEWLGFEGRAFDATLDLGAIVPIHTVGANFLQDVRGGIYVPHTVDVFASDDGKSFEQVGSIKNDRDSEARYLRRLSTELQDVQARFVRLLAHPSGQWLFVDEVFVDPAGATAVED